jgi:hypothetical protein
MARRLGTLGIGVVVATGVAAAWLPACSSSESITTTASGGAGGWDPAAGGNGGEVPGSGGSGGGEACAIASASVLPSPVDVIVAVDQSASMGEEIAGVVQNLDQSLAATLAASGLDYHVIFVAGDLGLPMGPEYFHADAPVNSSDALTLLLWTYDGSYKAPNTCDKMPSPAVEWKSRLRYEGYKVFIVVTDDDPSSFDCDAVASSCSGNCGGCQNECAGWCPNYQCPTYADQPAAWGGADFPTELYALEPAGMFGTPAEPKWTMHAIVPVTAQLGPGDPIQPLHTVCNANGNSGETSGVEYQKLAVARGGLRFPSCDTDYSPVFETIAATIVPLACRFEIEQTGLGTPDPDHTNVTIDWGDAEGPQTIPQDESAPCDAGAQGWQWTDDGTAIILCGAVCAALESSSTADVSITVGCETVVK